MRCTKCLKEYSRAEFDALPLVQKNGGRATYHGTFVHEYRVCPCGCHVLLVLRKTSSRPPASIPSGATPSIVPIPMFAEGNHGRRR